MGGRADGEGEMEKDLAEAKRLQRDKSFKEFMTLQSDAEEKELSGSRIGGQKLALSTAPTSMMPHGRRRVKSSTWSGVTP